MIITIFIAIIVSLSTLSFVLAFYILYRHFSQKKQRLIKIAQEEANRIVLRAVAKAKAQTEQKYSEFEVYSKRRTSEIDTQKEQLELRKIELGEKDKLLSIKESEIEFREKVAINKIIEYNNSLEEVVTKLSEVANYPIDKARTELFNKIEQKYKTEFVTYSKNLELKMATQAQSLANNLIAGAMEKYVTNIVAEKTSLIIKLPSDEIKGKIIGKEGRNIKTFEQFGGVDILIDDTPAAITINSFSPIRREIAHQALKVLIEDGRIQPIRIEEELIHQAAELEVTILKTGTDVLNELKITVMDLELVKFIGRLKYRTSYGQNVLMHSIEVAKIAGSLAAELQLDKDLAIRAGLLHDIGKALDTETVGTHVELGVEIAKRCGESDIVINAIAAHHDGEPKKSVIASIVAIADTISASRPGARNNDIEAFFVRMSDIEKYCMQVKGVKNAYAVQSGRQIRVIVDPTEIDDDDLFSVKNAIAQKIKDNIKIPGDITITVIRELRDVVILRN